jgi:hypothetical protein
VHALPWLPFTHYVEAKKWLLAWASEIVAALLATHSRQSRDLHGLPAWRTNVLNRFDRPGPMAGEAEVKYLDGDFRIVKPGSFVRCAVTGVPIPLEELKYWDVELQEAYANPEAVLKRHAQGIGQKSEIRNQ